MTNCIRALINIELRSNSPIIVDFINHAHKLMMHPVDEENTNFIQDFRVSGFFTSIYYRKKYMGSNF